MAKPLDVRAAAILRSNDAPTKDLTSILPELAEARDRELARQRQAEADSVDIALAEPDRDEAAANADRAGRLAKGYADAITGLQAKLEARARSESRARRDAERAAALAERDELAERFAAIVGPMCEALPELFAAVQANADRMSHAGLKGEADAEAKARGVPHSYHASGPVDRFVAMKIPTWSTKGRCWPPERLVDISAHLRAAAHRNEAVSAEREAQWGWYRLSAKGLGGAVTFSHRIDRRGHEEKRRNLWREPWEGEIRHAEANRLRELGVTVEPITAPVDGEVVE